ncbi:sigma-70 family RNA polymerase sigma factor [Nannocystaceae bacterium ST9]
MSVRLFTPHERTPAKRALPRRFTTLYRTHYDFVWRCAQRLGVAPSDVDDVVQETFLIALRRLDEFTDEGAAQPSTWLFAILRNVLRNHARGQHRRSRKQQAYGELRSEAWVDAREAERTLGIGLLDRFLASLDPERRSVFVLAELEGHDSREVGEALGINPNTARTRLRAARKAFAATFEHDDEARERLEQVVDASRRDPPRASERSRERVLQAIVVAAPLELVGTASAGLGLGTWLGKLTVAGLTSLAAIGAVVVVEARDDAAREHAPRELAEVREPAEVRESPRAPELQRPTSPESPVVEPIDTIAPIDPIDPIARPRPAKLERPAKSEPPASDDDESSRQLEALRILTDARAALLDGRAEQALRLVEVESWPDAGLADRARALEIGALCALDRADEAKAIADAHADRWLLDRELGCW